MPTYEYVCKSCGEHLEVVQSFTDAALTECAACGGVLRKVFQPIGIAFKGSGFYKNDSRASSSSSSSNGSGAKSTESKPSSSDASPSSDTKASGSGASKAAPASSPAKSSNAAAS